MPKLETLEDEHVAEYYENETENLVVIKYAIENISEEELKAKIA